MVLFRMLTVLFTPVEAGLPKRVPDVLIRAMVCPVVAALGVTVTVLPMISVFALLANPILIPCMVHGWGISPCRVQPAFLGYWGWNPLSLKASSPMSRNESLQHLPTRWHLHSNVWTLSGHPGNKEEILEKKAAVHRRPRCMFHNKPIIRNESYLKGRYST